MNKAELVRAIAKETNYTIKDISVVVDSLFSTIENVVANGDEVAIQGFGKFERHTRSERDCVNPSTGKPMHVGAMNVAKFTIGSEFKKKVRG